mmetsp:Transcript_52228/g.78006  ORF Transcript_52228/g.78006 Transcript_52228/m.78006 type:complete len:1156 (-) Transcript_52228:781-4248(-)
MRDHIKSRFPELKVKRVNDRCYTDTFFSSIPSVRGFKCWQLFAYQKTGLDVAYLMRKRSSSVTALPDLFRDVGAPTEMFADNAPEFKSERWKTELRRVLVKMLFTEPDHPSENLSERRGGAIKAAVIHVLFKTGAPLTLWCYCLEYVVLLRSCIARRRLGWKTPHELHFHSTPDISVFRFVFWQPVWYHIPRSSFPHSKMLPGRFIGIATDTGDAFCYLIWTGKKDGRGRYTVLARGIVKPRQEGEEPPEVDPVAKDEKMQDLEFFKRDAKTVLPTPDEQQDADEDMEDLIGSVAMKRSRIPDNPNHYGEALSLVNGRQRKRPRLDDIGINHSDSTEILATDDYQAEEQDLKEAVKLVASSKGPSVDNETQAVASAASDSIPEPPSVHRNAMDFESGIDPSVPRVETVTEDDDDLDDPEIFEHCPIGLGEQVTRHMESLANEDPDLDLLDHISGHYWHNGALFFKVKWKTDEESTLAAALMQSDHPLVTAKYILKHRVGSDNTKFLNGRYTRWARGFLRKVNVIVRRMVRSDGNDMLQIDDATTPLVPENLSLSFDVEGGNRTVRLVRRTAQHTEKMKKRKSKRRSKPGRNRRPPRKIVFGIVIPRNVEDAKQLDKENGNTLWMDAVEKEIATLQRMKCFDFREPGYKPSEEYQFCKLTMLFEGKHDGRRKARLVAGGHTVDPRGVSSRSTVVKGISVRLLDLIAHRDKLITVCGDVGNAFITADCMEKVYSRAGPEFGELQDAIVLINKALYGLRSSSRAFRLKFAEFLRSLGFVPTRYDRDVWMRLREAKDGYDYICTHVDDFKVCARNPKRWIDLIAGAFCLKSAESPKYYLGNDYEWSTSHKCYVLGCATYIKECIRRLEDDEELCGQLQKQNTPLPPGCHPELDESPLLDARGMKRYQMLIGMMQWACTICRLDISFATSSLSRFSAAPREGHLELAYYLFGYLKKFPNRRLLLDSRSMMIDPDLKVTSFDPDFLAEYPDAEEEIDPNLPAAYGDELDTSIFFDADHAHDHKTRRSITGIIVCVGRAPVSWLSRRQGCIATSTYCAEFVAMRTAVEEAISLRYMLRCLGVPVTMPTNLFGDNYGSIQSASLPHGDLKKKHVALSYHYVREAIAARIVEAKWVSSGDNYSDIATKPLGPKPFTGLRDGMMV